nr:MAG TPA: hypothetical protein [Caudoviricetes sp.]
MSEAYLYGQSGGTSGGEAVLLDTLTMTGSTRTKEQVGEYEGPIYEYYTGFAKGQTLTYAHKGIIAIRFDYNSSYSRVGAALWIPKIGYYGRLVNKLSGSTTMDDLAWNDSTASTIYLQKTSKASPNTISFDMCRQGLLSVSILDDTLTVKAESYTYNTNSNDYPPNSVLTVYVYGTK